MVIVTTFARPGYLVRARAAKVRGYLLRYKLEGVPTTPEAKPKPSTLECVCTAFRGVIYDGRRAVTACDAFQDALDKQGGAASPKGWASVADPLTRQAPGTCEKWQV